MPAHITMRKMRIADVPIVHAIDCATTNSPWSSKLYQDCINVGYDCWVLEQEEGVRGFGIMSYAVTEAHLLNFAIHPKHHRQGLGTTLLQHLLTEARLQGAQEMFLEVRESNVAARTLYQNFNFVEIGLRKEYYPAEEGEQREDAITLALPL